MTYREGQTYNQTYFKDEIQHCLSSREFKRDSYNSNVNNNYKATALGFPSEPWDKEKENYVSFK